MAGMVTVESFLSKVMTRWLRFSSLVVDSVLAGKKRSVILPVMR